MRRLWAPLRIGEVTTSAAATADAISTAASDSTAAADTTIANVGAYTIPASATTAVSIHMHGSQL